MAAITICSDFGAPKNKVSHCVHCFPIYLPWSGGAGGRGVLEKGDEKIQTPICKINKHQLTLLTRDWFQIGKGVHQGCILSTCLFSLYAEHIMRNAGLKEAQAGIKIAGRNINNLRYADDTTPMAESEEELKKPLDESESGELKSWLKAQHSENKDHGIWSHHFMGNRWGNSGHSVRLYFGGLQNHCRW